jgi:hypothetical protein
VTNSRINKITIKSAQWGSGASAVDVTARVIELLHREPRGFNAKGDWLHKDPRPYHAKAIAVVYEYEGTQHVFVAPGGERISYELLVETAKKQQ